MTVYAYDTEFLEDGRTIELISIGIVSDDGREYYAVNSDAPIGRIKEHDWLTRNVLPHLPIHHLSSLDEYIKHPRNSYPKPSITLVELDRASSYVKPKWVIANDVRDFLLSSGNPTLWADYAAYDHVALAQLWGPMIDLPKGIPMWTHDLQYFLEQNPDIQPFKSPKAVEHDALQDARGVLATLLGARNSGLEDGAQAKTKETL
jgi:hypothetical protein